MENYNLTPEQLEAAKTCKSPEKLVALAKEQGMDVTLEQAAVFLDEQAVELADDELENVAGGSCGDYEPSENPKWKKAAAAEGRTIFCTASGLSEFCCHKCENRSSFYARQKEVRDNRYDLYIDVKCYSCGWLLGNMSTGGTRF